MDVRRRGTVAALLTAATALAVLSTPVDARAETPTPVLPTAEPAPPSSHAPADPGIDRQPLPPPVYQDTPAKVKQLTAIAGGACQALLPEPGFQPPRQPWHLARLNMAQAWQIATGDGVRVAVIDTGIAVEGSAHTPGNRFAAYDVLPERTGDEASEPLDCQHGTVVASLIGAQQAGTLTELSGIAPGAQVIGIRALYGTSQQEIDGVVAAVWAAIELEADVINISQAAIGNRGEYADAIQAALDAGIVVVAAAGNGNTAAMPTGTLAYPAVYPGVISVGMTNRDDVADPESLSSPGYVSVAAPGVDLTSTGPSSVAGGQVYQQLQRGTSYSAPIVSGVVALLLEHSRSAGLELGPAEVKARLEATADPPAGAVPDPQLGFGIVNPVRALTGTVPPATDDVPPPPSASATPLPAPPPSDPRPLRLALTVAGSVVALVTLGIGARIAIPAARRRGGRPAQPA